VTHTLALKPCQGKFFWSNGAAWGTFRQSRSNEGVCLTLSVLHGELTVARVQVTGVGTTDLAAPKRIPAGEHLALYVAHEEEP